MKDSTFPSFLFPGAVALLAVLFVFSSHPAQAQEKVAKNRGNIVAIDLEAKSLTLDKPNGETKVVFWDDNTTLQSDSVAQITDLKPGIYVRCIMVGTTDVVGRIRHEPNRDRATGDASTE